MELFTWIAIATKRTAAYSLLPIFQCHHCHHWKVHIQSHEVLVSSLLHYPQPQVILMSLLPPKVHHLPLQTILIVTVAGELCKLARVTGPEFPHPFSPVERCLPTTGRCAAVVKQSACPVFVNSSGAVWESRWPSWAVRPNEPYGFRGRKAILNHAHALVSACP